MLAVEGLSVRYGATTAVDAVDLTVPDGSIVAVLGPSGSGKTSLLRAIAGLEPVAGGSVHWDGADITGLAPHRRDFGLMFQDHALFSHHTVLGNVAFGLRMHHHPRVDTARRVAEVLELVGLSGYEPRSVDQLSGGEQQRVALARALAPSPRLLMLDEPLASVDRERREQLAIELHRIIRASRKPTLLVTHDLDEAFTLADTVVILDHGRVAQAGAARDVWRAPSTATVARFLGVATEFDLPIEDGAVHTPWGSVAASTSPRAWVGFRPADLDVRSNGPVEGTVRAVWFRRDHFLLEVDTAHGSLTAVNSQSEPIGAVVHIAADLEAAVIVGIDEAPDGLMPDA